MHQLPHAPTGAGAGLQSRWWLSTTSTAHSGVITTTHLIGQKRIMFYETRTTENVCIIYQNIRVVVDSTTHILKADSLVYASVLGIKLFWYSRSCRKFKGQWTKQHNKGNPDVRYNCVAWSAIDRFYRLDLHTRLKIVHSYYKRTYKKLSTRTPIHQTLTPDLRLCALRFSTRNS